VARKVHTTSRKRTDVSHLDEEVPTLPIGAEAKKILFTANPEQPALDDRAFAVTGGCNVQRFTAMVQYLAGVGLFARVTQIGIIVRITLPASRSWTEPLRFNGEKLPLQLDAVRKQLGEEGDPTALSYVLALLWEGAGWTGADDVTVEESPISS